MASSFLQGALLQKSSFLGQTVLSNSTHKNTFKKQTPTFHFSPIAKFNALEILGGRGLCNGEAGLQEELKKNVSVETSKTNVQSSEISEEPTAASVSIPENGFEKELQGLTGGFPGGEKGLLKFIQENPPPPKKSKPGTFSSAGFNPSLIKKPKPPELPILLPGMIVIVKNTNSPYYMYCGIIQKITDGKAGVLFEGGVWDRLITFRLEELERREKGPPMDNPRSAILETVLQKSSSSSPS